MLDLCDWLRTPTLDLLVALVCAKARSVGAYS
jgi:hypothetical protein